MYFFQTSFDNVSMYVEVSNLKLCICKPGLILKFYIFRDSQLNEFWNRITEFYHPEATEERLLLLQRNEKCLKLLDILIHMFPIYVPEVQKKD